MRKTIYIYVLMLSASFQLPAQNTIDRYEYWFDADYTGKVSINITPDSIINVLQTIPTTAISPGLHVFNIRFQDMNAMHSSVISQHFYKLNTTASPANNIVLYEYWFDNNYAGKVSQAVSPQNTLQLITGLETSGLSDGLHILNIRFKDEMGIWSSPGSQHFYKADWNGGNNNLVSYEYWFDYNYAGKISQTVTPQSSLQVISGINTTALSSGLHVFNIRFRDSRKTWSSTVSQHFFKRNITDSLNYINSYRYWIDTAISSMTTVTIPATTNPRYIFEQMNFANLDTGAHIITMQFRDIQNMWSSAIVDTFYQLGKARIDTITPAKGGNIGDVTVSIFGTGFYSGTTVKLTRTGYPDIEAPDSLTGIQIGQIINATFDLRDKALGFWNVVVTVPGDTIMIIENGFKIDSGIAVSTWADIVGFNVIRLTRWQNYTLIYENNGNIDARGVPVWLAVPQNSELIIIDSSLVHIPQSNLISFDTIPLFILVDSLNNQPFQAKVYCFIIPNIAPGQVGALNFKIKVNSTGNYDLMAWADQPFYQSPFNPGVGACLDDVLSTAIGFIPTIGCFYGLIRAPVDALISAHIAANNNTESAATAGKIMGSFVWDMFTATLGCAVPGLPKTVVRQVFKNLLEEVEVIDNVSSIAESCDPVFRKLFGSKKSITAINSFDPNDKVGPIGSGQNQFVSNNNRLSYVIHFENVDTATAAAQNILIIDTLDLSKIDISTLEFGFMNISDTFFFPPANNKSFSLFYDLRPENDLLVKVDASLNESTGILKWTFISLDPITMLPTTNPSAGFLPPNVSAPEGEGSVFFSVKVKDSIPNNSVVSNKAYIIFDNNPAIETNLWSNTIDNIKPHSKVDSLPQFSPDSVFTVSWSGVDTSSGILNFSVYYSVNGGSYKPWKINTHNTFATFYGRQDSTYRFYSIATDSALNVEAIPPTHDAITSIRICNLSATINANGPTTFCQGDSVILSANAGMTNYLWSNGATTPAITVTASGTFSVSIQNSSGCNANSQQVTVTVNPLPQQPGAIVGNSIICFDSTQTYSVDPVANATGYSWILPANWTGSSTTNTIHATAGPNGGNISVKANNNCGSSSEQILPVTVNTVPSQPGNISGNTTVCQGTIQTYSITGVPNATGYLWTLPSGWIGSSTSNTIQITIGANNDTIRVRAINSCGNSIQQKLGIAVNPLPAQPGTISGNNTPVLAQTLNYTVNTIPNATGYNWQLSGGGTIQSGQNSTSVAIYWTTAGNYNLSIHGINSCGNGPIQTLPVTISVGTGIINPDDRFQIKVVPNPSAGEFYLTAKGLLNKKIRIDILNNLGQSIHQSEQRVSSNDFNKLIDLKKLANGVYYIKITIDNEAYLRKAIKVN